MNPIKSLRIILFSPTGTTRRIVTKVAQGLGSDPSLTFSNLSTPRNRETFSPKITEEMVLIGVPVYEEHVPKLVLPLLETLKGKGQPAILISVYGNIGFGMSLKELSECALGGGLIPVACASFIGEHSFSRRDLPLAEGRPDEEDLSAAYEFGKNVSEHLSGSREPTPLRPEDLPGKLPLMSKLLPEDSAGAFTHPPRVHSELCDSCGACVKKCPVGAIGKDDLVIDEELCLRCFSCVRVCAREARKITYKKERLVKTVLGSKGRKRKEPQIFIGSG